MTPSSRKSIKYKLLPSNLQIGLIGHDKSICDLTRLLVKNGLNVGGIQTFDWKIHEKDQQEWTQYLMEKGLYESIFDCAASHKIELYETEDPNDQSSQQWFSDRGVNFIISCGCRWLLKKPFLETFNYMVINLHPTILPAYGGGPAQTWQVLNNEEKGGWSAHWIDSGIDRGDLIYQTTYAVPPNSDPIKILSLRHKKSPFFFSKLISLITNRKLPAKKIDLSKRLYFHSLHTPTDARIDFSWDAKSIEQFVRAFGFPYAGAFGYYKQSSGNIIKVHISRVALYRGVRKRFHPFASGNILNYTQDGGVIVNLRCGQIKILTVRDGYKEVAAQKILKLGGRFLQNYKDYS